MKKKILILGAGEAQIDAIKYCKTKGLEVCGCSYTNHDPGIPMLDYFEQCDLYHDGLISKDPNKLDVDLQYDGQNMMRFLDNGKNEIGRCSKEAYEKTVKDVADYAEYKIRKLIEGSGSNG